MKWLTEASYTLQILTALFVRLVASIRALGASSLEFYKLYLHIMWPMWSLISVLHPLMRCAYGRLKVQVTN